jgi:hypothetical protein
MLSKESMKGLDIVSVTTDLLYTLEQAERNRLNLDDPNAKKTLDRGQRLLSRLASVTDAQISNGKMPDLFMFRVVTALEKELRTTPTNLKAMIERAQSELEKESPTSQTRTLVEKISELTMKSTNQSVAALSNPLQ